MADFLTADDNELLHPLNRFYASGQMALPRAARIEGAQMPEPYRRLLVHQRDMTSTLEDFYGEKMCLRVLHSGLEDGAYAREILLYGARTGRVAEYGSIRIFLEHFEAAAGKEILSEQTPLGTILSKHTVAYVSAPRAFFEIESDAVTALHFKLGRPEKLFGRRNRHSTPSGETLADIVEILAPVGAEQNLSMSKLE